MSRSFIQPRARLRAASVAVLRAPRRVGLLGLSRPERNAVQVWAKAHAISAECFQFGSDVATHELEDMNLLVIEASRDSLFAIAECGRLGSAVPSLRVAVLGRGDPALERAALRAGASFFIPRDDSDRLPWQALRRALDETNTPRVNAQVQAISPGVSLDRSARTLHVDGQLRTPTAAKFELLCYFLDNAGRAISARELVNRGLLMQTQVPRYRCVIRELRSYLGSARDRIRAVSGYGYRLDLSKD